MKIRSRIFLPIIGLLLFGAITHHSFRMNKDLHPQNSKYFWWSVIRLDSDPTNKQQQLERSCADGKSDCTPWNVQDRWVDPGLIETSLLLSALPAFFVGKFAVRGLANLGISELSIFLFLMPVLIAAWYYLIGWLIDRWSHSRLKKLGSKASFTTDQN